MKKQFLFLCLVAISSLHAIDNNVELIGNSNFSSNVVPAQTVSGTSNAGMWYVGDNTLGTWNTPGGFVADAATGAFVLANGTNAVNIFDNFLGQLTTETGVNTGRYRFSINALGNQPFYIKISSVATIGTELTYILRNPSSAAIQKQSTADYAGYTMKITPTETATTYSADLDFSNTTPSAIRVYVVFPKVGSITVDDISLKRSKDIPTTYYIRPANNTTAWANFPADQVITTDLLTLDPTYTYYLASGTYTGGSISITTGKIYGGFSGDETSIDLNTRAIADKDENGIIEPWEFSNEAIITTSTPSYAFTQTGIASGSRLLSIQGTGGEVNGVTITDFNFLSYAGPICLGLPSGTPSAANNISGKEGILRLCTVKKIKSAIGIVMSTNKYSIIDRCLIESNVITGANTGGAVFLNACGGKVTGCVIRNNAAIAASGRAAGLYATSIASTNMDAIVENCLVYNNYSGSAGAAIRGDAQTGKRGIEIINCTVVNNKTGAAVTASSASVELINGGTIVNSIIVGDQSSEIRANTTNNYVINTAYGEYATSASTLYGSNNVSGKAVADFSFTTTTTPGVMIPDYTTPLPWTATETAKYDEIRKANFKITDKTSVAVTAASTKTYPASYLIGGTGASIVLSAYTLPTTDLMGINRQENQYVHFDLGAYQYSSLTTAVDNSTLSNSGIFASGNQIIVPNAIGSTISIYSVTGQLIKSVTATANKMSIAADNGIYIVKVGNHVAKVSVK